MIAIKPISMLDEGSNSQLFAYSVYDSVDFLILISLIDPLGVIIFKGSKHLSKAHYKLELITSMMIMFISLAISMYMTDTSNAYDFEKVHPLLFALYAFLCLSRIYRYLHLSVLCLRQIKAIGHACHNMKPFFMNLAYMLGTILLVFGQIGMNMFGGKINSGTPKRYAEVSGGGDGTHYERANFNDFPNTLIMLWS